MSDADATDARPTALRRSVADRFWAAWPRARWLLVGGLAVAAFVLGYVGFRDYYEGAGDPRSTTDLVYLALQLFVLESGSVPGTDVPWQLEVGRLTAALASATAVLSAAAVVFQDQLFEWRLRRQRDHVVICGLGSAGTRLAGELLAAGRRVVAIERDPLEPAVAAVRRRGAVVIIGDVRDRDTLHSAHLDRATHLVCLTGADDTNADVVMMATELVTDRTGPALVCLARIRDPELCVLLRSEELASPHRGEARLEFFNVDEQGARAMLRDHSPFPLDTTSEAPPDVLVVGLNRLGQHLVVELARQWRAHPAAAGRPIPITVLDPDAHSVLDRLHRRYPQLEHSADITPVPAELDPLDNRTIAESRARAAYVCLDDDSAAVQAALSVRSALADRDASVVVELLQGRGMARLIDRPDRPSHQGRIEPFNVLDRTMGDDLLLGGTYELLARAVHQEYLDEQRRQGATTATNRSMVPWEQLAGSLKESNRDQAAHIGTKLAAIGCGIAPLTEWDADKITFTDAEVEMLAEMEHDRFVDQRRRDGWTDGPRDSEAKTSPYLVPWDSLSEDVKELDRRPVRDIPAFLARAGYQIVPAGPSAARS